MPADIAVGNFPKLQKVEITNPEVKVSNLKDLKIPETRFPDIQRVHVINQKDIKVETEKASGWVPGLVLLAADKMMMAIEKMLTRGIAVTLDSKERMKPMTVVIVDIEGNPVDMVAKGRHNPSPAFPMIMHGNVTTIAGNCVSGRIVVGTTFTAGNPYQLPNVGAKRVIFTALPANGGTFAIGGKTVSAQSGSESGSIVYPTGTAQIDVNSANVLWIDGSNVGDVLTYNILS